MSARFATDDPASMLPSLSDTAEVSLEQRQPRDGDRRRCSCVDTGAPDEGSDDVHGNNHRRTTAQGDWLDDGVDVSVPDCQQHGAEHRRKLQTDRRHQRPPERVGTVGCLPGCGTGLYGRRDASL